MHVISLHSAYSNQNFGPRVHDDLKSLAPQVQQYLMYVTLSHVQPHVVIMRLGMCLKRFM